MRDDGRYPGSIVAAYVAEDQWETGSYVLKLDVDLEGGGAVTCRVSLSEKDKETRQRREAALRELELPWPFKAVDLAGLKGRGVDINLKTSAKGRQNAYLATAMPETILTPEQVDALIANAADESNVPF